MKSILIVVDLQNGFIRYDHMKDVSGKIVELSNRHLFDYVIATRFLNREGSQYTEMLNWRKLLTSPDVDLVDGLYWDTVVDKNIYSCLNEEFLAFLQKINDGEKPTHIFICGVDTDCCVLKTATDLFENGIMPLVLVDYCNSNGGPDSHLAGQLVMSRLIGRKSLIQGIITNKEQLNQIVGERKYKLTEK